MLRVLIVFVLPVLAGRGLCAPLVERRFDVTASTLEWTTDATTQEPSRGVVADVEDARKFLKRFGYTNSKVSTLRTKAVDETEEAIKRFQRFFKMNVTGKLDNETLTLMNSPRCGLPDITDGSSSSSSDRRQKRYEIFRGWQKSSLTYSVLNYPSNSNGFHTVDEIDKAIDESFMIWTEHSGLGIGKSWTRYWSDLELGFYGLDHGDSSPFDGPGNILAHAFFPDDGRIHMDTDETWCKSGNASLGQYDFRFVLAHEIGHALGLQHSSNESALMYPYYIDGEFRLGLDDVMAIQKLYGRKPSGSADRSTGTTVTVSTNVKASILTNAASGLGYASLAASLVVSLTLVVSAS